MRSAIALRSIKPINDSALLRALQVHRLERLDFVDAFLAAQAELTGLREVHLTGRATR
jgi:hypothetical protein